MHESWMKEISLDEIEDETCRNPATEIGVENAIKVCKTYGGSQVYLPKIDQFWRIYRDRQIRERYYTTTAKALAIEYGITVHYVYQIVNHARS